MIDAIVLALAMDAAAPRWRAPQTLFEPANIREPWSPPLAWKGRLLTTDHVHVGTRANLIVAPGYVGIAVTVQISLRTPF